MPSRIFLYVVVLGKCHILLILKTHRHLTGPSNGVQVKCPDDWGIYCPGTNSLGNRNICPAGFYCPDPSTMKICPSRHYCREGSMTPNPCFIFEVCPTGSSKPDGSMYGVFITIVLFVVIYSSRTCYFRVRNKKRKKRSQKKNALTSSLEYLVPRWRRDTTLSDVMAFVGLERDVEDSGMRSSNSSASLISTGSARTNTSDVRTEEFSSHTYSFPLSNCFLSLTFRYRLSSQHQQQQKNRYMS